MGKDVRRAARAMGHLLVGAGLSLLCYLTFGLLFFTAIMTVIVVGAGVLPETVLLMRRVAGFERRRTAAWSGVAVPEAYLPLTGPLAQRVQTAAADPGTWRDLRWYAAHLVYGLALMYFGLLAFLVALIADGVWAGLLGRRPVLLPLVVRLADTEAALARALLLPSPATAGLTERIEQLTATRADAVAAHGAELRRIERDLHDGAQARLVALSMRVGLARRAYGTDAARGRELLDQAQDQVEEALAELRQVVRGIHPPVLTDRGLTGAVRALAAGSGLDVAVTDEGVGDAAVRPPAAVEAAAYFAVAEALTNAAKHSGAASAEVRLVRGAGSLWVAVRDEGRGGVDESGGSGLVGIRRRAAALDGRVAVRSPAGGPTVIEVELPCAW